MNSNMLICSRCKRMVLRGVQYCPFCGEAVNPDLVRELQWLFAALLDLDERIANGQGEQSVEELRDEYRARYQALRTPPATEPAPAAPASPLPAWLGNQAASTPHSAPTSSIPSTPQPAGPAFSWSAFIADQAIAIMAYLGGFLLLVATLSFEISNWNTGANAIKLAAVITVYVAFGSLGLALRRADRLRTVGGAYLGVFALMTPLVALAVYRFALQGIGVPLAGMICIAALYAAAIYLILAWQTRFATYGYLGWVALIVASRAGISWAHAPNEWWVADLAAVALVGLAARRLALPDAVREPGMVTAIGATALAAIGAFDQAVQVVGATITGSPVRLDSAAVAAGAALTACAFGGWSLTTPRAAEPRKTSLRDLTDWLAAAYGALAVVQVASWLGADSHAVISLFGALALAEFALAVGISRLTPDRAGLRRSILGLALALALIGTFGALTFADPNWPLSVDLGAAGIVALGIAALERQPVWVCVGGGLFTAGYRAAVVSYLVQTAGPHPDVMARMLVFVGALAGLTLAIWLAALLASQRPALRLYAAAAFAVSFGDGLYTTAVMRSQHAFPYHQTAVLAIFAICALIAGWRLKQPVLSNFAAGMFGVVAVLPLTSGNPQGHVVALVALGAGVAALLSRALLGKPYGAALYVVALWATLLATIQLSAPDESTASWYVLGIPFVGWLLIAQAALGTGAALWENAAWGMAFPAILALGAVALTSDHTACAALVFVMAGGGAALRYARGRWWNVAWQLAAIPGSALAVARLSDLGQSAPNWQVALLVAFGVAAYLIAVQERAWWLAGSATIYGLVAITLLPAPHIFISTLVFTFVAAALGGIIRWRFNIRWATALYALAVGGSCFAVNRITPNDGGHIEALLLVFAAVAYVLSTLERNPWSATVPTLYVLGAILAQPDAHALLPLALLFALLGLVAGRLGGPRWYLPPYLAAAVATGATAILGQTDGGFEPLALLILALMVYLVAAIESRPEGLIPACVLGGLALAAGANWLNWPSWQAILAFAALGWLYALAAELWRIIPWLKVHARNWWEATDTPSARQVRLRDSRLAGVWLHSWAGLLVGLGAVVASWFAPDGFTTASAATQAAAVALLVLGGQLVWHAYRAGLQLTDAAGPKRALWYLAGESAALAITWEARWLGADNVQALVLAPGSYQLLVGALLPVDERLGRPVNLGRLASSVGALLLLLPTLGQSLATDPNWLYVVILATEALVITGIGVGTRARLLVLLGSSFVGVAAIRGAILAYQSGAPWELVLAGLAVLLLGGATWLSLRGRRAAGA